METLIIAGGDINKRYLKKYYEEHSKKNIIAVDKGLEILYELNIEPNHIVGDFDSVDTKILQYYQNNDK